MFILPIVAFAAAGAVLGKLEDRALHRAQQRVMKSKGIEDYHDLRVANFEDFAGTLTDEQLAHLAASSEIPQ